MLDQIAKTSNTLSFLLLLLFVAWGPIAQGSVFAGGTSDYHHFRCSGFPILHSWCCTFEEASFL